MEYRAKAEDLCKNGQYEEALAVYEEAIRLSPTPDLYAGRGAVLEQLARQAYEKAKQYGYRRDEQEILTVNSEALPTTMSLTALAERVAQDIRKYRLQEPHNDQYSLEMFRRAIVLRESDAWSAVELQFSGMISLWIKDHPLKVEAMRYQSEEDYIALTFERFWLATANKELIFTSLASTLHYLRACLNSIILDTLRAQGRPKEESIPDYDNVHDLGYDYADSMLVEDHYHENELWEALKSIIPAEHIKERRLAYLLFHANLKPKEITRLCPDEFASLKEIYRLKRNIMERMLRSADKIRWRLSTE